MPRVPLRYRLDNVIAGPIRPEVPVVAEPRSTRPRRPFPLRVWRNPLARGVDRAESAVVLLLIVLWMAALPVVATIASARWSDAAGQSAADQRSLTAVAAVVDRSAQVPVGATDAAPVWIPAPVRWTGSDGRPATGITDVPASAVAGDRVTVWLNPAGRVVPAPPSPAALAGLAVLLGAGSWLLIGLLLLGAGWTVRRRLDRRRLRAWGHEWAQVEPGRHPF